MSSTFTKSKLAKLVVFYVKIEKDSEAVSDRSTNMSYCEDIFEKALKLILKSSVKVKRNYRPNWLKNPETGKSLELDFYIPEINLGFEIQGQHHFTDSLQKERDIFNSIFIYFNRM